MRSLFLRASPLLFFVLFAAAVGCGSSVVSEGSGAGNTGTAGTGASGSGGASFDACTGPGQCVIVPNGCCGTCGKPGPGTLAAVNQAQVGAFQKAVCPEPHPCPACAQQMDPNVFAYCGSNGHCLLADVPTDPVSACTTDADCTLRIGSGCCEGCSSDPSQLIAVSKKSDFAALVCAPGTSCPDCAPMFPPDAVALCQAGHCAVAFVNPGGPSNGP